MILVTGATGTVGSEVVRQLVASGQRPRAFVRDPRTAREMLGPGADYVAGDLDRPETLPIALTGVDRVFLLTRQSSRQPDQERAVVDAAVAVGVRHMVKLSVFRADDQSELQIARQHAAMERYADQSAISCTFVRPVFFMQNLVGQALNGAIHSATRTGRVAMVDARDVASVVVHALTSPGGAGKTHTLTGPQALSFDEVAETLSTRLGTHIPHVRVTPDAVRDATLRAGAEAWFAEDMARLHTMLAAGYEDVVTDDVAVATGTTPRSLAEFGSDTAERFTGRWSPRPVPSKARPERVTTPPRAKTPV
jgi:uncharacterized protein YbjT (DUF2867 family)